MSDTPRTLTCEEYVTHMEKTGLFSDSASHNEHDARVWRYFFQSCAERIPFPLEKTVTLHLEKYAFCTNDPAEDERDGLNLALVTPMVDPFLPVSAAQFAHDLPALTESIERHSPYNVITDTFGFTDGYGAPLPHTVRLTSPVAALKPTFNAYLESLNAKRRKKFRHVSENFQSPDIRFELSHELLTTRELDLAQDHLNRRWGSDGPYALAQTLWSQSCAIMRPEKALFMRVFDKDLLVFVQTLLIRGPGVYCQSIFKNEDAFFDGIAPYTDFKCIEALCGSPHQFLDPSCRCSLDDPASIGIAKRATVNMNTTKPLLAAGTNLPEQVIAALNTSGPIGDEA